MSVHLYVSSGICNQLVPIVTCIRACQKTNRKLHIYPHSITSYMNYKQLQPVDIRQLFDIDPNITFHSNNTKVNAKRRGGWNGEDNLILSNDPPEVQFDHVCHCIGIEGDVIGGYSPFPAKQLKTTEYINEIRIIAKESIKPNDTIIEKTRSVIIKPKTIGLHIRTLDGGFVNAFNKERLIKFIKDNQDWSIYLSTDNLKLEKELLDEFGNIQVMTNHFGSKYSDKVSPDKNGLMNGVCELYNLSRCERIVGTASSSFSFISWILSDADTLEFWNDT